MSARTRHASNSPIAAARSLVDRALLAIGADPAFTEDLLGDLAEERAGMTERHGPARAKLWYLLESLRSVPHLVWSAARHGTPRARRRLAAFSGALLLASGAGVALWMTLSAPPARLSLELDQDATINNYRPVRLTARVLDAAGRVVGRAKVNYRLISGNHVPVSRDGVVECMSAGVSLVRASLGPVSRDITVRCAPVRRLMVEPGTFYVGDTARPLEIRAFDAKGQEVFRLAGLVGVEDSTVARVLPDGRVLPLRPGETSVSVEIGDRSSGAIVTVYERVASFEGLRPDQQQVVAPVRLAPGAVTRWSLPQGEFFIAVGAGAAARPVARWFGTPWEAPNVPVMTVEGPIMCIPELRAGVTNSHCLARGPGATLTLSHPASGKEDVVGVVALNVVQRR